MRLKARLRGKIFENLVTTLWATFVLSSSWHLARICIFTSRQSSTLGHMRLKNKSRVQIIDKNTVTIIDDTFMTIDGQNVNLDNKFVKFKSVSWAFKKYVIRSSFENVRIANSDDSFRASMTLLYILEYLSHYKNQQGFHLKQNYIFKFKHFTMILSLTPPNYLKCINLLQISTRIRNN